MEGVDLWRAGEPSVQDAAQVIVLPHLEHVDPHGVEQPAAVYFVRPDGWQLMVHLEAEDRLAECKSAPAKLPDLAFCEHADLPEVRRPVIAKPEPPVDAPPAVAEATAD